MSRSNIETAILGLVTLMLVVAVVYLFARMQSLRPVDYLEDMRFKSLPTANPLAV